MGETVYYELRCDRCDAISGESNPGTIYDSHEETITECKKVGWVKCGKEWYCPECVPMLILTGLVKKYKLSKEEKDAITKAVKILDLYVKEHGHLEIEDEKKDDD